MLSTKSLYMKSFNNLLFQLFDEVMGLFPDNREISKGKMACETLKSCNVSALIKGWKKYITEPYGYQIQQGNFDFFMKHDFEQDLSGNTEILETIQKFRGPIEAMPLENRDSCFSKIQKLTELSDLYN